jgi:hypothetical protein
MPASSKTQNTERDIQWHAPFGLAMRADVAREKAREATGAKAETEGERARNKAANIAVVFIVFLMDAEQDVVL